MTRAAKEFIEVVDVENWEWRSSFSRSIIERWTERRILKFLRNQFDDLGGRGVPQLISNLAQCEWLVARWRHKALGYDESSLERMAIYSKHVVPLNTEVRNVLRALGCLTVAGLRGSSKNEGGAEIQRIKQKYGITEFSPPV